MTKTWNFVKIRRAIHAIKSSEAYLGMLNQDSSFAFSKVSKDIVSTDTTL